MLRNDTQTRGRKFERLSLGLLSMVFGLLFFSLYQVFQQDFQEVSGRLAEGTMVNLNGEKVADNIGALLVNGYYFDDKKDVALVRTVISNNSSKNKFIDNVGELNKSRFFVGAAEAEERGGESFRMRVKASLSLLGFTGNDSLRYAQEKSNPPAFPAVVNLKSGKYSISGRIQDAERHAAQGILVKLTMVLPQDSTLGNLAREVQHRTEKDGAGYSMTFIEDDRGSRVLESLTAYARTDKFGKFSFLQLPDARAYRVLPMQPGFQFGSSQGTADLNSNLTMNFTQAVHTIRLLSARDFNILKKEKTLIVRTPQEFNNWFMVIAGGFLIAFLLVHILLSLKFPASDQLILPVLMSLTGISLLTLLSLQDPLRDRFLARDTFFYLLAALFTLSVLLFVNIKKLTPDSGFYRMLVFRNNHKAANGWPWALLAIALLILTLVFGAGPEGSGVKVNLFGIQPSEFVKFGIILFLAGFFAANERFISEYKTYRKRWSFFSFALAAIVVSIFLFLVLGDLGPSMVICFTFIILFSFARGDFKMMIGSVVGYVLLLWLIDNLWMGTLITIVLLALIMVFKSKQLSESTAMALVVLSAFLLIDQIPQLDKLFPGPVQRLVERKAMWQDAWNNEVYGGDHVANGIWAMAGGGLGGQGIGEGFAKSIPEAHTDMILPALGEEFGLAGIACIFMLFLIYLHRAILIGRQTGTPFLFYLCAGIGLSTFVQFLLIAGGSTGALPLSGVSLPLVSYGGSSLMANMIASGFLLNTSRLRGSDVQMSYISQKQDRNLMPALAAACMGSLLLTINVSSYLLNNRRWVVQPALVADRSGARMFSYNPRIHILMNKLQAGALFDRKGRILATSNPELIRKQMGAMTSSEFYCYNLDSAVHKRLDRYYPYQEHMFFWTGDANTGIFSGGTNGYFAEYEHAAELRGFRTPVTKFNILATRFREDRFLPRGVREMTINQKDYAELAPLLLAGINSTKVEEFKQRNRDVTLTLDARLQTDIQMSIAKDDSLKDNRVSVVIVDDSSGDVLTSAVYPLPPLRNWDLMTMAQSDQNKLGQWITTSDLGFTYATQPGSTAKILTAMASFNKLGIAAVDKKYQVDAFERIRTKGIEPDETGIITLERAIVKSNNVYFIKLANQEHLEEDMANLYLKTGMFLRGIGGYYYTRTNDNTAQEGKWLKRWRMTEFVTKPEYDPRNIRKTRAKGISGMAWGQGELIATPAAVARLVSAVSNHGNLTENRYVLQISDRKQAVRSGLQLTNPKFAALLKEYMLKQSEAKVATLGISVGGKTGTPERVWKGVGINDGWYVFFTPNSTGNGNIVVCIRIESTKGSSDAVKLAGTHVIPALLKFKYINGFHATARKSVTAIASNSQIVPLGN